MFNVLVYIYVYLKASYLGNPGLENVTSNERRIPTTKNTSTLEL